MSSVLYVAYYSKGCLIYDDDYRSSLTIIETW